MEKVVEVEIAANKLKFSPRTIRRMLKDPRSPLRGFKTATGRIRVDYSSILDCLEPIQKIYYDNG